MINRIHSGHMTFGQAIEALKDGRRAQRVGWNGKGMWIALTDGLELQSGSGSLRGAALHRAAELVSEHGDLDKRTFRTSAHIDMRSADGTLVIGWLASQTDMLADDWVILD